MVNILDCLFENRYAIDWQYNDGLIRVLYGSDASLVCTLKLHDDYPSCLAQGRPEGAAVTLQSANGLPPGVTLESLQVICHYYH